MPTLLRLISMQMFIKRYGQFGKHMFLFCVSVKFSERVSLKIYYEITIKNYLVSQNCFIILGLRINQM